MRSARLKLRAGKVGAAVGEEAVEPVELRFELGAAVGCGAGADVVALHDQPPHQRPGEMAGDTVPAGGALKHGALHDIGMARQQRGIGEAADMDADHRVGASLDRRRLVALGIGCEAPRGSGRVALGPIDDGAAPFDHLARADQERQARPFGAGAGGEHAVKPRRPGDLVELDAVPLERPARLLAEMRGGEGGEARARRAVSCVGAAAHGSARGGRGARATRAGHSSRGGRGPHQT